MYLFFDLCLFNFIFYCRYIIYKKNIFAWYHLHLLLILNTITCVVFFNYIFFHLINVFYPYIYVRWNISYCGSVMPFLLSERVRSVVQEEKWTHPTFKLRMWHRTKIQMLYVWTKMCPKVHDEIAYKKSA